MKEKTRKKCLVAVALALLGVLAINTSCGGSVVRTLTKVAGKAAKHGADDVTRHADDALRAGSFTGRAADEEVIRALFMARSNFGDDALRAALHGDDLRVLDDVGATVSANSSDAWDVAVDLTVDVLEEVFEQLVNREVGFRIQPELEFSLARECAALAERRDDLNFDARTGLLTLRVDGMNGLHTILLRTRNFGQRLAGPLPAMEISGARPEIPQPRRDR